MPSIDTRHRVVDILSLILDRPIAPEDPVRRSDEDLWNSLKHIELILALEDAFDIRFDEEELGLLDSLDAIVRAVEARLAA